MTPEEQELYDWLKSSLPPFFFAAEAQNNEMWLAAVKTLILIKAYTKAMFDMTFIDTATDIWLSEHAKDRGTFRQANENDTTLRARVRSVEVSITREALLEAVQNVLTANAVVGTPALLEMPRDQAFFLINQAESGTGGTFTANPASFDPNTDFQAEIYRGIPPARTNKLVFTGATAGANNGTYTVTGLTSNAASYVNVGAVAGADPAVSWRHDRYFGDGAFLTEGAGRHDAYFGRGYRASSGGAVIIVILPFGTTEAVRVAVVETLRLKKAAGIAAIVERRQVP